MPCQCQNVWVPDILDSLDVGLEGRLWRPREELQGLWEKKQHVFVWCDVTLQCHFPSTKQSKWMCQVTCGQYEGLWGIIWLIWSNCHPQRWMMDVHPRNRRMRPFRWRKHPTLRGKIAWKTPRLCWRQGGKNFWNPLLSDSWSHVRRLV